MERKTKIKELRQKLANLTEEEKQALVKRGLIATIEGRVLSIQNTILVYLQSNSKIPSVVGGYQQWKRAGRQVRKGEHGMMIWFPVGEKDENGSIQSPETFYTAIVFDVSQVE